MTEVSSIFGVVSKRVPWKDCRSEAATSSEARLAGLVERVTYHNAEKGFCVLRAKARGHREIVTVAGHSAIIAAGEWITASGEWINDPHPWPAVQSKISAHFTPRFRRRHRKISLVRHDPGRWPVYAKKLVRAFGDKVFDVIEATPDRLREVEGIGPVRAARILAAWAEQKVVREIMVFLHSHSARRGRCGSSRPMVLTPSR
jgi:exodeoxyribonuclease V alpha subunit